MVTWFLAGELWSLHLQDHVAGAGKLAHAPRPACACFCDVSCNHGRIHSYMYCVRLCSWCSGGSESFEQRPHGLQKPEIDTICPFAEKFCWRLLHWKLTLKSLKKHRSYRLRSLSLHAHTAHTPAPILWLPFQWLKWKTKFSKHDCRVPCWVYRPADLYSCLRCLQTHRELCSQRPLISERFPWLVFSYHCVPWTPTMRNPLPREAEKEPTAGRPKHWI